MCEIKKARRAAGWTKAVQCESLLCVAALNMRGLLPTELPQHAGQPLGQTRATDERKDVDDYDPLRFRFALLHLYTSFQVDFTRKKQPRQAAGGGELAVVSTQSNHIKSGQHTVGQGRESALVQKRKKPLICVAFAEPYIAVAMRDALSQAGERTVQKSKKHSLRCESFAEPYIAEATNRELRSPKSDYRRKISRGQWLFYPISLNSRGADRKE